MSRREWFIACAIILLSNGIGIVYANNQSKTDSLMQNEALLRQLWKNYSVKCPQKVEITFIHVFVYVLTLTLTTRSIKAV